MITDHHVKNTKGYDKCSSYQTSGDTWTIALIEFTWSSQYEIDPGGLKTWELNAVIENT